MRTKSNVSRTPSSARRNRVSRPIMPTSSSSAPASSMLAGTNHRPWMAVDRMTSRRLRSSISTS